jgi:hypothetical protein
MNEERNKVFKRNNCLCYGGGGLHLPPAPPLLARIKKRLFLPSTLLILVSFSVSHMSYRYGRSLNIIVADLEKDRDAALKETQKLYDLVIEAYKILYNYRRHYMTRKTTSKRMYRWLHLDMYLLFLLDCNKQQLLSEFDTPFNLSEKLDCTDVPWVLKTMTKEEKEQVSVDKRRFALDGLHADEMHRVYVQL